MFLGRYHHNLDEKGRLTVPARFRDILLAEGAFIMQGFDHNLMVLPTEYFETLSARVRTMNLTDPDTRLLRRMFYSSAQQVEIDKAGRILVPSFLRQTADLQAEAIMVGMGEYFEIWSPGAWSAQAEELEDAQANPQRFIALNLTSA